MTNYPLLKFVIFFIGGILAGNLINVDPVILFVTSVLLLISVLVFYLFTKNPEPAFLTCCIYFLSVLCGVMLLQAERNSFSLMPKEIIKTDNFLAEGTVSKIELRTKKEISFNLDTDSVFINSKKITSNVILICKLKDASSTRMDSLYEVIAPGNIISLKGSFSKGRDKRNPGEFDYNKYLNEHGISGIIYCYDLSDLKIRSDNINLFQSFIHNMRKYLDESITALHEPQTAALLKGLVLADRSEIDPETKMNFINAGVVHILAVSGLNVAYVILIFMFFAGRSNPYTRTFITIAGILIFMFLTGASASVFRAVVMAAVILIALISNRSTNIYNSMALAALVILFFNPSQLFDPGFQLSFAAVLSIAAIYPVISKEINLLVKPGIVRYVLLFAAVSLSAQIGTLPFTLIYFNKLSVVALLANLFVVPLSGILLASSFFTIFLNILLPPLAFAAATFNELCTHLLFLSINYAGSTDYAFLYINQFSLADAVILYMLILIVLFTLSISKNGWVKVISLCLIIVNALILLKLDDKELIKNGKLNVIMIDVGQGDAALLIFPNGKSALIDAGEATAAFDNGERIIIPLLNYLGIKKIDYGLISHMDSDHYSGFVSLIHEEKIGRIIKPLSDTLSVSDIKFENFVKRNKIPLQHSDRLSFNIGGAQVYMFNDASKNSSITTTNDRSAVIKIVYGKTSFLFTGDIGKEAENFYTNIYGEFLNSDYLKVSHHGSRYCSSAGFLSVVSPNVSIISAGIKNKFKHPSPEVLQRLNSAGSVIRRTDKSGAVFYCSNGTSIYNIDWRKN